MLLKGYLLILFYFRITFPWMNILMKSEIIYNPTVTCVFRQSCILPCNVDPSSDTVIHWDLLTSGLLNVHSYYDSEDQLGRQDQQFKGRTSLFKDLISRGNASLKLTGVKIQDEGRYRCYSSTERGSKKTFIQLKVEGRLALFLVSVIYLFCYYSSCIHFLILQTMTETGWFLFLVTLNNPEFRGRTSLFRDQLSRGDASLLLTGVKVQDEGKYKCFVFTENGKKELYVYLKIDGKISFLRLFFVSNQVALTLLFSGCACSSSLSFFISSHVGLTSLISFYSFCSSSLYSQRLSGWKQDHLQLRGDLPST
uniref:Ig-like domain-containing protein n=1 Tax=Xiphophorus couchianus TaxID=32473 RepID=A0A3B5M931_9TELE